MITEEDKREVKKLARLYKVKVFFYEARSPFYGYWNRRDNSINLNVVSFRTDGKERDRRILLSCFFHELGHTICYENKWYYNYHYEHTLKKNKKTKALLRRIALRAERFVDKIAGKEFDKHYPTLKYPYFYNDPLAVEVFRKHYIQKNYA